MIAIYADDVATNVARPKPALARLTKLMEFFGAYSLSDVKKNLCRAYVTHRMTQVSREKTERAERNRKAGRTAEASLATIKRTGVQAARRELHDFRAAINHYFEDEGVQPVVNIELPDQSPAREHWITEAEAARLLFTAWRKTQPMPKGGKRYVARHIARFILVCLYTGTRSSAVCAAAIRPTVGRPYVDLEAGVFYRRPISSLESDKRRPPARLSNKILAHLRRWERLGICQHFLVEWEGQPVKRVSQAFARIAAEAGLPHVTPHVLRHTAITWAKQRGSKSYDASAYFGVSEKLIERVYGHHDPEHHRDVTKRMDRRRQA